MSTITANGKKQILNSKKRDEESLTNSSIQTQKLGEELAEKSLNRSQKKGAFLIGLSGELGGGKTTFLQGFAKGLGIKEKIASPTFVIFKKFQIPSLLARKSKCQNSELGFRYFYHFDCYRIEKPEEILGLGFEEIINDSGNIVAIEWPEKIKKVLPKDMNWLKFKWVDKNKRKISFIKFKF